MINDAKTMVVGNNSAIYVPAELDMTGDSKQYGRGG